jgi:DNA polymerase-4
VSHNKFLAKIASDLNKPDGLTVVPDDPEGIKAFLAPLPVGRLWGVGTVTQDRLERAGIRTIGDVQRMSVEELAGHVGRSSAVFFKELADGLDDRPVETSQPDQSISREHTFDVDVKDRSRVREVLLDLVEDVGRQLRESGRSAGGVQIKLRWKGFETITRQKKLDSPVTDDFTLAEAALGLFEREKLIKPVRLIGVGVYALADGRGGQMSLFDDAPIRKREKISRTVDSIRKRFGNGSIRRGH